VKRAGLGKGNTYENLGRGEGREKEGDCLPVPEDLLTDQADGRLNLSIFWRGAGEGGDSERSVGDQPGEVARELSTDQEEEDDLTGLGAGHLPLCNPWCEARRNLGSPNDYTS